MAHKKRSERSDKTALYWNTRERLTELKRVIEKGLVSTDLSELATAELMAELMAEYPPETQKQIRRGTELSYQDFCSTVIARAISTAADEAMNAALDGEIDRLTRPASNEELTPRETVVITRTARRLVETLEGKQAAMLIHSLFLQMPLEDQAVSFRLMSDSLTEAQHLQDLADTDEE